MKRITIFCGSSPGNDPVFVDAAVRTGETLAQAQIGLVYGGARVGLMGAAADAALKNGGVVIGVIPYFLRTKEVAHAGLTELILVESMHERKMKMNELCDGVIALPGGYGTFEELFEMLTWAQLGLHRKPVGLLNVGGFYDPLIHMVDVMTAKGFLKEIDRQRLLVSDDPGQLIDRMKKYQPPLVDQWIHKKES